MSKGYAGSDRSRQTCEFQTAPLPLCLFAWSKASYSAILEDRAKLVVPASHASASQSNANDIKPIVPESHPGPVVKSNGNDNINTGQNSGSITVQKGSRR
jgi:hypothetical protein